MQSPASTNTIAFYGGSLSNVSLPPNGVLKLCIDVPGDATGSVNPLTVLMDGHKTITANFGITNNSGADYQFQMNFNSTVGAPPASQNIGAGNIYVSDSVGGCVRTALCFPQGHGLLLQPAAGVVPTNAYTIGMLFRFDAVSSWRRVLDFKAGTTDNGLYVFNGALNFFPMGGGPANSVLVSSWVQFVATRESTDTVAVSANGVPQLSFSDPTGHGIISTANALRFFKDDNSISQESAGFVARIRLYAAAMTPAQVALLDRTDCSGAPHFLRPWFDAFNVLNLPVEHVTPGVPYRLLASSNLTDWLGIATNTPVADPTLFTDPTATNHPNRMYRVVTP